jgi:hypothetical protein
MSPEPVHQSRRTAMGKSFVAFAIAAGLLLAYGAPGASAAQTPGPCVPLESQSWWNEGAALPFPGDMQHVHAGACFPYKQVISGNYTLDVVVKMHNEQGRYLVQVRIDDDTDQDAQRRFSAPAPNLLCSSVDCTFVVPVTVPTGQLRTGMHEWRVAAATAPQPSNSDRVAERNLATSGWQVCIRSCSGRTPANDRMEARGWYRTATPSGLQEIGYDNVTWGWQSSHDAEFPWSRTTGSYVPVSGTWQPPLWLHNGASGSDVEPVVRSRCWVDPDFHGGHAGTPVLDRSGSFQGRLSIDTTQLGNGLHRLVCAAGGSEDGFLDGVFAIPFMVDNGPLGILPPLP